MGMPAQVPADARIDRLAHDAVHAGEGADVDDPRGALLRQVHRLSDVQHHLAKSALARQIRARAFQNLVDVGFLAAREIFLERRHQDVLVLLLHALPHPRAQRFQRPDASLQLQLPEVLGIGVPDPLDQVRDPRLRAVFFQTLHQVLVRERVQAAENLSHDSDQRMRAGRSRCAASLRKRSRLRTMESRSDWSCTPGSTGVSSSVRHRSASDSV